MTDEVTREHRLAVALTGEGESDYSRLPAHHRAWVNEGLAGCGLVSLERLARLLASTESAARADERARIRNLLRDNAAAIQCYAEHQTAEFIVYLLGLAVPKEGTET